MEYNIREIRDNFIKGNIQGMLQFLWDTHKSELVMAFQEKGIAVIGKKDLFILNQLHQGGHDTLGEIKDEEGKKIYFNVYDILKEIKLNRAIINKGELRTSGHYKG